MRIASAVFFFVLFASHSAISAEPPAGAAAENWLGDYFQRETARVGQESETSFSATPEGSAKDRARLLEMLGLDPLPERSDLKTVVTGTVESEHVKVEKLHFQSAPGLYVTANLYLPKNLKTPAPTVLYLCGHSQTERNGVKYGSKVSYQKHPAWFARNGYVCLIIDMQQFGEIPGKHRGLSNEGEWWWYARGYTPAGVETWNAMRALDYLATRPEVDMSRVGVTGRSGGGAYSWFVAALDERVKVAAPVAGITDLQNHVVDGVIRGHCDCMYPINTHRWDFWRLAALVAPRPLLLANSDKDEIFPLDGVTRVGEYLRRVYAMQKAEDKFATAITEGPHKDTPELQKVVFEWFDRHLKGSRAPIDMTTDPPFEPEQLKVLQEIPMDAWNARIDETFTPPAAAPSLPESKAAWKKLRDGWMTSLKRASFAGWPDATEAEGEYGFEEMRAGLSCARFDFKSQEGLVLPQYVVTRIRNDRADKTVVTLLDDEGWKRFASGIAAGFPEQFKAEAAAADPAALDAMVRRHTTENIISVYFAPRGFGPLGLGSDAKEIMNNRRKFMLLGQTLESMQVWDARQAIQAASGGAAMWVEAEGAMAGVALYAAIFEPKVKGLILKNPPTSHREGATFLNVLRILDMPQAVAIAAERMPVKIFTSEPDAWSWPRDAAKKFGWEERLEIVKSAE